MRKRETPVTEKLVCAHTVLTVPWASPLPSLVAHIYITNQFAKNAIVDLTDPFTFRGCHATNSIIHILTFLRTQSFDCSLRVETMGCLLLGSIRACRHSSGCFLSRSGFFLASFLSASRPDGLLLILLLKKQNTPRP